MSTKPPSKRADGLRKTPPGKPPFGFRWLHRGEKIEASDRSVWGTTRNYSLCPMPARIGEVIGDDPETLGSRHGGDCRGCVRPIEPIAKKARASSALKPKENVDLVREWNRGYFCAVATFLKENFADGVSGTESNSLFRQGGNWRVAAREDIETFKRHGLITEEAANYALGIRAANSKDAR